MNEQEKEKVLKALNVCSALDSKGMDGCKDCPYDFRQNADRRFRCNEMAMDALALINDLKSENENLFSKVGDLTFALNCKRDGEKGDSVKSVVKKVTKRSNLLLKPEQFADKLASLIGGHSNYHGDSILSAVYALAEGKEVKFIKPILGNPFSVDELRKMMYGELIWLIHEKNSKGAWYRISYSDVLPKRDGFLAVCDNGNNVEFQLLASYCDYGKVWSAYKEAQK